MTNDEKREMIMKSKWGAYALNINLWDDSNAPITKVRGITDMKLNDFERSGILSDRMIGARSSFLTTTDDNRYILTKCDLRKLNLKDISALQNHHFLEYLDLSYNKIKDLTALGGIHNLLYLKVAHNKLNDVLKFTAPYYLTYVNLSHNNIKSIGDLSEFWSILRLDLSHNAIELITGLQKLKYLRYLNLSYNFIECVQNLDSLNIQELNLEFNCIKKFDNTTTGINVLPNLRTIILGHNRITSLDFFKNTYSLRLIDLKHNKIADLMEVANLKSAVYELDLRENSCTKWPNYKEAVLHSVPSLMFLDGEPVNITEKVSATTTFSPSINLHASQGLTKLILLDQLSVPKIDGSIIPYDEASPPLIILSGPSASKKIATGLHMTDKMPKKVKWCRIHTTRECTLNHIEMRAYHFVEREEFNEMARNGEFLTVEELVGDSYGFHSKKITVLRAENKIGITQMDLQATIQLKSRYPNARIILVLAKNMEIHREWIENKFKIFSWIKDSVENLWALRIGKRPSEPYLESMTSKINFISDIIHEIIQMLDLPSYSVNVRPQGTGATSTDIILHSRTMLPKVTKTRRQLMDESKHIHFHDDDIIDNLHASSSLARNYSESDLKVILDEQMNIIIDDDESKRIRRQSKMLKRRKSIQSRQEIEDNSSSESSSESNDSLSLQSKKMDVDPKNLMNEYVNIVLKSREMYINHHINNPGYYSLVLYSDEFEDTLRSLTRFIHDLYIKYPSEKPREISEITYLNHSIIPNKIEEIVDNLNARGTFRT